MLKEYGINGNMLHTKKILTGRKFKVKVNNVVLAEKSQENGIPQGEILSVTLFLIVVNEIIKHIPDRVYACVFADDLLIFSRNTNINTCTRNIQTALQNLEEWTASTGFTSMPQKQKHCTVQENEIESIQNSHWETMK